MQDLMRFEDVAELLDLDARDEKRNRLFLTAVCEEISLYLARNLLLGTVSEKQMTSHCEFYPEHYPVREFVEILDEKSGTPLELALENGLPDIERPDSNCTRIYRIQGKNDRTIRFTYRYGYELAEMPALIRTCALDLLRDRLASLSSSDKEAVDSQERLKAINRYRKVNL
jgi:hypothetical protein